MANHPNRSKKKEGRLAPAFRLPLPEEVVMTIAFSSEGRSYDLAISNTRLHLEAARAPQDVLEQSAQDMARRAFRAMIQAGWFRTTIIDAPRPDDIPEPVNRNPPPRNHG